MDSRLIIVFLKFEIEHFMQQGIYYFSTMSNLCTERAEKPLSSMAASARVILSFKRMNMCIDKTCGNSPKSTTRSEDSTERIYMTLQNITQRSRYSCEWGHWWSDPSGLHNKKKFLPLFPWTHTAAKGKVLSPVSRKAENQNLISRLPNTL